MKSVKSGPGKKLPDAQGAAAADPVCISIHSADTPELGEREFVFHSQAMRSIYAIATQVAGSDASILIYGETGTGKELFARLIHTLSVRSKKPFMPVNCGVLQGELFADKFFGHEAGAYTGAGRLRKGAFELAEAGTLFLDEVGELPLSNQVDFLRVLEERSFRRMGGEKDIPFLARIVAATNRPLPEMVGTGAFRADLFYRLNVVPVYLPSLRSRKEDIPLLAEHMLALLRRRYHRHDVVLHPDALGVFLSYSWPGNVRELRNLMERLVLLAQSSEILPEHLPLEMRLAGERPPAGSPFGTGEGAPPSGMRLADAVREAEIAAIVRAFAHCGGHKGKTAGVLGISERSLRYKMAEYSLKL